MDGAVIHRESSFRHHLLQIPIAQGIATVLTDSEQNDFELKLLPFEQSGMRYGLGAISR